MSKAPAHSSSQNLARRRVLTILMGWAPCDNLCRTDALTTRTYEANGARALDECRGNTPPNGLRKQQGPLTRLNLRLGFSVDHGHKTLARHLWAFVMQIRLPRRHLNLDGCHVLIGHLLQ